MLAAIPFVEWLAETCDTSVRNVELALWASLLAGLLFATANFILMMVTRWGDSDPTRKAFMFSVLVHLSLAFGAVAVTPPQPNLQASIEPPPKAFEIRVEGDEQIELEQKGNTRIWEKLPENDARLLSRTERSPLEFQPLQGPERTAEPLTAPDIIVPDLPEFPEQNVARPEAQQNADLGEKIESIAPLKIEDTSAQARPDINVPSMSPLRRRELDSGLLEDITVDRTPTRGSVDQIPPKFDTQRELVKLDTPDDPAAFLQRTETGEAVRRLSGPAPSELPDETPGAKTANTTDDSQSGSVGPPSFTRLRTRTPKMEALGGVERFKPDLTPRTPLPIPGPAVAMRESVPSAFPKDGLVPNAVRPNFDPIDVKATTKVPPTYRLRSLAKRQETARRYGGTDASEKAVEGSLQWLALHQSPDGRWDADGFMSMCPDGNRCLGRSGLVGIDEENVDRQFAGMHADAGVTGLTILAFLGAGYTHEEGQYADQVDRALSWLVRQQQADGFLGGNATRYARMYCHAIATYSLAEALGMQTDRTNDARLRVPLERAIAYIVDAQNQTDGGWRYLKGQKSDMSMFGWQLMALKSAEIAGIPTPPKTRELMIQFLKDRSLGDRKGLASYRLLDPKFPPLPPTPSMTAEALFCKQMLGIARTNPQSIEAVEFLQARLPNRRQEDLYYWYYGTLAMYQYGGAGWQAWNSSLRDLLVADQRVGTHAVGSWDPKAPWGPYGGRVFSTAVSTLCLEVYYRFLPLYQVGDDALNSP